MRGFADSMEHLLAEMERIDLPIRACVAGFRAIHTEDAQFRGLFVSEQQVDAYLAAPLGVPAWLTTDAHRNSELTARLDDLGRRIDQRKQLALAAGVELRLDRLQRSFALDDLDIRILLACLAVELDTRYEKLYAYLQDDVTMKRPTIELVLALLEPDPLKRFKARERFGAGAPLCKYRLIEVFDDAARPSPPFIGKVLKVDDRISSFLLGSDLPDARIAAYLCTVQGARELASLILDDDTKRGVLGLLRSAPGVSRTVVHLQGPAGAGRRSIASALCRELQLPLLAVDLEHLQADADGDFSMQMTLVAREARLAAASLYWDGFDTLLQPDRNGMLAAWLRVVETATGLTFYAGAAPWFIGSALRDAHYVSVAVARPAFPERILLWRNAREITEWTPAYSIFLVSQPNLNSRLVR